VNWNDPESAADVSAKAWPGWLSRLPAFEQLGGEVDGGALGGLRVFSSGWSDLGERRLGLVRPT
jgi:hypothetical protein